MSLLVEMKETIKLPTGLVWLNLALSIFFFWGIIDVDSQLIPDKTVIDATIAGFSQAFPYIAIMTVSFTAISFYGLYYINLGLFRWRDSKYNSILKKKNRGRLNSYDFNFIKDIINKMEKKILLSLGTLIISIYFLPSIRTFGLVLLTVFGLQFFDLTIYFKSLEFKAIPDLQLYYVLSRDSETLKAAEELHQAVYAKDWNFLQSKKMERMEKLKELHKISFAVLASAKWSFKGRSLDSIWKRRTEIYVPNFPPDFDDLDKYGLPYYHNECWEKYSRLMELTGEMIALRGKLKETNNLIPGMYSAYDHKEIKQAYQKLGEEKRKPIGTVIALIELVKTNYDEYHEVYEELKALKL